MRNCPRCHKPMMAAQVTCPNCGHSSVPSTAKSGGEQQVAEDLSRAAGGCARAGCAIPIGIILLGTTGMFAQQAYYALVRGNVLGDDYQRRVAANPMAYIFGNTPWQMGLAISIVGALLCLAGIVKCIRSMRG